MSVYKSKRGESSVQFIETARQLEAHTFACCMKAPKRYERFLTGRIMELSSEVHDRVRAANNIWPTNRHEAQLRRDELMRANNALQNLSPKLQLLYDSILQNPEGYGWIHKAMQRWGDLICEEAKLIAAVKKNDRQRYGRYMDDGYLIHESRDYLQECLKQIRAVCADLGIRMNEKKTRIVKLQELHFLKTRFYLTETGKVRRKMCRKSARRMRRKLKTFRRWMDEGKMTEEDIRTAYESWRGHMRRGNSYRVLRRMDRFYKRLMEKGA